MKLPYLLAIVTLAFFLGCNSETEQDKKTTKEVTKMVKEKPKTEDFRERLKTTTPASEKQLQSILPTTLGSLERTEFTKSRISQNDIASAGAIYTDGTNKKIIVSIVDGASKDGLLAIQTHYMAQTLELNSIKSSGHEKTYEKNGLKILETYVKKDEFYRISYLYDMRFGVTLETHKLPREALDQIIEQLNLNELKNL